MRSRCVLRNHNSFFRVTDMFPLPFWLRHPARLNLKCPGLRRPDGSIERLESRIVLSYTAILSGTTATLTGSAASDTITISASGGLLSHSRFAAGDAGFNSEFDFNSA